MSGSDRGGIGRHEGVGEDESHQQDSTIPRWIEMAQDNSNNSFVQVKAVGILTELGEQATAALVNIATDASLDPLVRIPAAKGVAQRGQEASVYGARKMWVAARKAGHEIGRDQIARLMKQAGISGVSKLKRVRTTRRDDTADRPPDLVDRDFTAARPNALWVTDLTYVPTWSGMVYVCFIIDAFSRKIVGWRVADHMRTDMVLDALEMARFNRGTVLEGLISHSDAGSQYTSIRYGERLDEIGAVPSIGSIGDSYDNALAEATNSLYKTDLIRGSNHQGRWRNAEDVELATLSWVHWFNTTRIHSYLDDASPDEFEAAKRCTTDRPTPGWNPLTKSHAKPRALQTVIPPKACSILIAQELNRHEQPTVGHPS